MLSLGIGIFCIGWLLPKASIKIRIIAYSFLVFAFMVLPIFAIVMFIVDLGPNIGASLAALVKFLIGSAIFLPWSGKELGRAKNDKALVILKVFHDRNCTDCLYKSDELYNKTGGVVWCNAPAKPTYSDDELVCTVN